MSKADGIISTTLRLDTNTPEGWKAYAFLHNSRNEKKCRSYSELITDLLSACYDREMQKQCDPYLETREKEDAFVNWVKKIITDAIRDAGAQGILNFVQLIQKSGTVNPAIDPVPAASDHPSKLEDHTRESFDLSMDFINGWDADTGEDAPGAD